MAQPGIIVYSAADVDYVPMLSDDNEFTGTNTFQEDVVIDSDSYSLILGEDADVEITGTGAGALSIAPSAADTDMAITVYGTTNSGVLTWMEDEGTFSFDHKIAAPTIDGISGTTLDVTAIGNGTALHLHAASASSGDTQGGTVLVQCGAGNGGGAGGDFSWYAGTGGATGSGGTTQVYAGDAGDTSGNGGTLTLGAGWGSTGGGNGGDISIIPGGCNGAGTVGKIHLENENDKDAILNISNITADRTFTFPNDGGTFAISESNQSWTIGDGTAGVDYALTFDGEDNDGIVTWKEDEARFELNDDLALNAADNDALILGAGLDMKVYYDGTSGNIDTDLVGASDLTIDCGTAKTVVLEVPVYNDCNVGGLVLRTGGTAPGVVQILDNDGDNSGIYTVGFAVNEEGSGVVELPHNYKEGTDLVFHVHWGANDAPSGTDNVRWQVTYSISRDDNTFPDSVTVAANDTPYDTQYEWLRTDVATITGSTGGVDGGNIKIGDQFHFTLKRITAAGDAFSGEALIASVGFHYQQDTVGSRTVTAK